MVADHINYLTFEDPGAVNTLRRALKLAHAGDVFGAAETAGVDGPHALVVSDALRRGMRFAIGAEVDNDPRARPDAQNIVDAMRPDGLIRSVNFVNIEHPEKGADWPWPFDNPEFAHLHEVVGTDRLWELYVAKLLEDLEKLPAHIVGHFYSPANNGRWPALKRLEEYEDRLLAVCHARGLAVEVNTRFLYRDNPPDLKKQYLDANARLVRKAQALGVGIAVGSDAHSPKDQGNAFDVVLKMLDDARINEIVFPVGGRLARVALRATREHLEAQDRTRDVTVPGSSISGLGRAELGLPEQSEVPAPSRRESARAAREAARAAREPASKRTSGPARSGKRTDAAAGKSSSRRSSESSASSNKAKAVRATAPAPAKKKPATSPAKPKAPAKPVKATKPVKAAKPVKATKPSKAAKPTTSSRRAAPTAVHSKAKKTKPSRPPAKKKTPKKKVAAVRPAPKRAKPAAKKTARPAVKVKKSAKSTKASPKASARKKSSVTKRR